MFTVDPISRLPAPVRYNYSCTDDAIAINSSLNSNAVQCQAVVCDFAIDFRMPFIVEFVIRFTCERRRSALHQFRHRQLCTKCMHIRMLAIKIHSKSNLSCVAFHVNAFSSAWNNTSDNGALFNCSSHTRACVHKQLFCADRLADVSFSRWFATMRPTHQSGYADGWHCSINA